MKVGFRLSLLLGGAALWGSAQIASAAVNCSYGTAARNFTGSMALNITTLTAARDAPIGTLLYVQEFHQTGPGVVFQCDVANATMHNMYSVLGLGSKLNFNSGTYAGKVYATGVPGIGVSWFGGQLNVGAVGAEVISVPISGGCSNAVSGSSVSCTTRPLKFFPTTAMVLIKTGPMGTGTIRGSELGRMVLSASFGDSAAYQSAEVGIRGDINVVGLTCRASDVTVPMGRHKTSVFTGKGSTTPSVNFLIQLTGCPGFPGYYGNTNSGAIPAASQTAVTNVGNIKYLSIENKK